MKVTLREAALTHPLWTFFLAFLAMSALYFAALMGFSGGFGFPLDDAFIHLQYAKNIFGDGQMAFNRFEPSGGSSAPLFPLLLALFHALFRNWYLDSILCNVLAALASIALVHRILLDWTKRADLAFLGGLLTVIIAPTVIQAYSGMESSVYVLFFLAALWAYGTPRRRYLASALFAASVSLRPEMMLMLPLIVLERTLDRRRIDQLLLREIALHGAIWALFVIPYFLFNHAISGHYVPTTFGAKAVARFGGTLPSWFAGLFAALKAGDALGVLRAIVCWPLLLLLSLGYALAVECFPLLKRLRNAVSCTWTAEGAQRSAWRLATLTLFAFPIVRGMIDPVGLVVYQFQRYFAHLTPLAILLVIGGSAISGGKRQVAPLALRSTLIVAFIFSLYWGGFAVLAVSNINRQQVAMAQWLKDNTPADALIATNDIGAVAFVGERRVLDVVGLIEPAIVAHYLSGGTTLAYLQEKKPDWVVIHPNWFKAAAESSILSAQHSETLNFNVISAGPVFTAYKPSWP